MQNKDPLYKKGYKAPGKLQDAQLHSSIQPDPQDDPPSISLLGDDSLMPETGE